MKYLYASCLFLFVAVCAQAQNRLSNSGKLSLNPQTQSDLLISSNGMSHALILVNSAINDSVLKANDIYINAKFNNIWSVQIPSTKLEILSHLSGIEYVEMASRANAARFKNDIERHTTSVDKVQNGLQNGLPENYSGKGIVVGIVDIGFQCNNPTFYTSDGQRTRIKRLWMQNNTYGPVPAGFNYGTEVTDTAMVQWANDMDGAHGTHVAGIAAGSGYTTPGLQYRGMAPGADIVLVGIKYSNDTLGGSALGDYVVANPSILDAYKYIFDYAASVSKPAVINLSWGMHTGPHDGTSLFDLATEILVAGKGRVLVGANGNEGDNLMHWNYQFNQDTVSTFLIENGRGAAKESVYVDFWGSANKNFSIKISIIDTNKNIIVQTPFISNTSDKINEYKLTGDNSSFKITMACENRNPNNQKGNITVMVDQPNPMKYAIMATISSDSAEVHGWNSGSVRQWTSGSFTNKLYRLNYENEFINGNTNYTAGENGGTSKAVISVGALAARSSYENVLGKHINDSGYVVPVNLARFSSRGPTVDGRTKPNISAPGFDVPSSINNKQMASWMLNQTLLKTVFRGDTNFWTVFSGTSMASPHVTGIVALILEANPNLTAAQIKTILETTATVDQNTGTVPNNNYGYGKVNAFAAVQKALQYAGINSLNTEPGINIYPNPSINTLSFDLPDLYDDVSLSISGIDGQLISEISPAQLKSFDTYQMNTSSLAAGIYFVRFYNGGQTYIYKLIKA